MPMPLPARAPRWLTPFLAGLAFALLMTAAFPPFSWWGCSLLALAPLVWLAERQTGVPKRPRRELGCEPPVASGGDASIIDPPAPADGLSGRGKPSPFRVALFAMIGSVPFYAVEHAWLWDVAGPGMPVLVFLMSLFPMLFVWALIRLRRWRRVPVLVVAPMLWAGLEHFRGTIAFDGYPWFFIGHPLIDWPWLADAATALGAVGVSAIAAAAGATVGWLAERPSTFRAGVALAWTLALGAFAGIAMWPSREAARWNEPIDTFLRVGVVQTNMPQSNKMAWPPAQRIDDLLWFLEMTEEAARSGPPDLIVWPETMFPGSSLDDQSRQAEDAARVAWFIAKPDGTREGIPVGALAQTFFDRQKAIDIPMVVGAIAHVNARYITNSDRSIDLETDHMYNSAYAIDDGRVIGRYDKVHLTPFGEVMPYISAWPWLEQKLLGFAAAGMSFDLSASTTPTVLEVPVSLAAPARNDSDYRGTFQRHNRIRLATPICFESTDAALCRRLVGLAKNAYSGSGWGAPVIIVNPTNDGWFGNSNATREQHLQLARWRAVENGVPVVRAANTGISCLIDHHGRVIARGVRTPDDPPGHRGPSSLADGILVAELPLAGGRTIYSMMGDWLGQALMILSAPLLLAAFWPVRRFKPEPGSPNGR